MSVQFDAHIKSIYPDHNMNPAGNIKAQQQEQNQPSLNQTLNKAVQDVNGQQTEANASIADLLSGKTQDINSVVANVAQADMSFKLLVGVRNKLVAAYKETMKMQV